MSPALDPAAWIDAAARDRPQAPFLETPEGIRLDYAGLRERSGRYAAALAGLGVEPGDRVAVRVEKSTQAVLLYVACLRLGAVFVPINVANTVAEFEHFVGDSQPALAVVPPSERALFEGVAAAAGVRRLETLGAAGEGTLPVLAQRAAAADLPAGRHRGTDLAALVYTSGTTGRSKGAMLTRANLASNAAVLAAAWHFTADDVLLHVLPLFHVHGLFAAVNTVLASGSSLLLTPRFDAAAVLALLPRATVFMGVPTHYTRLLQEPGLSRHCAATMRLFVSGSAPLLAATHGEFLHRTGHEILERYGMTETLFNTSNPYHGRRIPGSVGLPLPGIAVRVANPETGVVAAGDGVVGALELKGPNVCAGYWRDAGKTSAAFTPDGWFKTGDLGRIDADGYVYIVGRAKDLVISGGYNVYPKEVETELDALPGVLESAVFGVPHADFGEAVIAAVVRADGTAVSEAGIITALQARLARYKVPKRVVFMDELPRNTMGKVQKNLLRAAHAASFAA